MKRFYSAVSVISAADGLTVALDGRAVRTPLGRSLAVGQSALAEALAAEWQAQGETIRPHTMPLTQLVSTAIDRVGPQRPAIIDELLNYAATDLLCYRAESPGDLVERQQSLWQPVIDWGAVELRAELIVTTGVVPVSQPFQSLARLREIVESHDSWRLTALQCVVAATGSLLLGLALVEGRLDAEQVFRASELDETYQIELWGEDPEASRRRRGLRDDVAAAARFLHLCR